MCCTVAGAALQFIWCFLVCAPPGPLLTYSVLAMAAQRFLLWQRRNNTVYPFNETVQQVFARISALRDSLDGPQVCTSSQTIALFISFLSSL